MVQSVRIVLPGVDFTGQGLPKNIAPLAELAFASSLYAAYLPIGGTADGVGFDWSGHERTGVMVGDPANLHNDRVTLGGGSVDADITLPFSSGQIAGVNGSASFLSVVKSAGDAFIAGSLHGSEKGFNLHQLTTNNGRASQVDDDAVPAQVTKHSFMSPFDANRGTRYEMIGGSWSTTARRVVRRHDGAALIGSTPETTTMAVTGGTRPVKLGRNSLLSSSSGGEGTFELAFFAAFTRYLSDAEWEAAYQSVKALLAKATGIAV